MTDLDRRLDNIDRTLNQLAETIVHIDYLRNDVAEIKGRLTEAHKRITELERERDMTVGGFKTTKMWLAFAAGFITLCAAVGGVVLTALRLKGAA